MFEAAAPKTLALLDARLEGEIRQGDYIKSAIDDDVLALFRAAHEEANAD